MQHLTEEELVSHYYHDAEAATVPEHLRQCRDCAVQFDTIRRVLELVSDAPVPDRGERYGEEVWTRLRWKLGSSRRRRLTWASGLTAAAALALAFFAGHFWRARHEVVSVAATQTTATVQRTASAQSQDRGEKVLLLVVGDHLDSTERVLTELANADPDKSLDIEQESRRAGELVLANRIYRQTASQRGNERIAAVLAEIEPVLIEISHSGKSLSSDELTSLQRRIQTNGLLFKVRVIGAQTTPGGEKPPRNTNADAL
ncbi:MAG TPA: hypothetical protein VF980_07700 [Thermoanaerobaculia bacterium]